MSTSAGNNDDQQYIICVCGYCQASLVLFTADPRVKVKIHSRCLTCLTSTHSCTQPDTRTQNPEEVSEQKTWVISFPCAPPWARIQHRQGRNGTFWKGD